VYIENKVGGNKKNCPEKNVIKEVRDKVGGENSSMEK
jgi:hypothetical protein